jgi:hypothetical protein
MAGANVGGLYGASGASIACVILVVGGVGDVRGDGNGRMIGVGTGGVSRGGPWGERVEDDCACSSCASPSKAWRMFDIPTMILTLCGSHFLARHTNMDIYGN